MRKRLSWMSALGIAASLSLITAIPASAAPIFEITEAYVGLEGEDGTTDWFEVTNYGDMEGNLNTLFFDDSSANPLASVQLPSIVLKPGKSAVILIEAEPADVATFTDVWGTGIALGIVDGPGLGLSQTGDGVTLFDGNTAGANLVDAIATGNAGDMQFATFEYTPSGASSLSVIGVNGAYESNPFFNDNLGLPGNMATLVGSPGVVPEPSSMTLIALASVGLGLLSYRRVRRRTS